MTTNYDDMANSFEEHAADSPYNAHYDRPAVLELLGNVRGRKVLDAGCGPGLYSEKLVRRGADVVAVDASRRWSSLPRSGSAHARRRCALT